MKYWFLLCITLSFLSSQAQLQFESFQEVLTYADEHAISIQRAEIGENIALASKQEAKGMLLPSINATATFNDNITLQPTLVPAQLFNPTAEEGTFEELTFGRKYSYATGVQAQWDVLNFQKIFAAQAASAQLEESRMTTEKNRFNTYNQLASTYYSLLLTQESIGIYEENVRVSKSILDRAKEKYDRGIISDADLNRAKMQQLRNQSSLNLANNNLDQLYVQLQTQLNTSEPISISDKPEQFTLEQREILYIHPEVAWQAAAVEKTESLLKQSKSLHLPSVSLVYQYNYTWATDDFLDFSEANELPQQYFGVGMNIPLFKGGATKQKVRQSEWELHQQRLQLENTKLVKQKEDELLQLQLDQAQAQLADSRQILMLQQENDGHAENTYQSGITSLDERLKKYEDLLAAQDSYLQSLAAFTLAQYKLYLRQIDFQSIDTPE